MTGHVDAVDAARAVLGAGSLRPDRSRRLEVDVARRAALRAANEKAARRWADGGPERLQQLVGREKPWATGLYR